MPEFKHIVLEGCTKSLPYKPFGSPRFGIRSIEDRVRHGEKIKTLFSESVRNYSQVYADYDFVYIEFESAINFELDIDKFENEDRGFRLASCKKILKNNPDGSQFLIYRASVYLNKKAVNSFLEKIQKYIQENTAKGNPRYEGLIANIEDIRAATLESFWQEPEISFPNDVQDVWWEVWLDRIEEEIIPDEDFFNYLKNVEIKIGNKILVFPEHIVLLIKGTPVQLRNSLLYTNRLSEIRKPVETADFFTYLDNYWQDQFIIDLNVRVSHNSGSKISVCLLDTGVNRTNPLLINLIPESNIDSLEPSWSKADTDPHGHGTPMAGLILYGDLINAFSSNDFLHIPYQLESVKILEKNIQNEPDLYGEITKEAVSRGELINPYNKRIVCMAVTSKDYNHFGKPSSWSSAIDQICFGSIDDRNDRTLVLVSSGNLPLEKRLESPLSNDEFSVQDPAQSFNALTIGAYTLKDYLDPNKYPGAELLANRGDMSPCNTTSICWEDQWPKKPDIVLEGGNDGLFNSGICDPNSLKLLSTGKGGIGRSYLTTFGDTSASTALATKLFAELYSEYSNLWPETIRGLIINSAYWTPEMLSNKQIEQLTSEEQKKIISRVGYGVPNISKARKSANSSLTLIAQRALTPYKYEDGRIQTNEFHLFDLPWPTETLLNLSEEQVTLSITLSYFIEPNPGNKRYAIAANYRSYGLRLKMIDRYETEKSFKARVSKSIRDEQGHYISEGNENWIIGSQIRDKGSIHKDIWKGNAADLALRNKIAIYPVGGWWRYRKNLVRYKSEVRYSLIISMETLDLNVDLYTPVLNQIETNIPI